MSHTPLDDVLVPALERLPSSVSALEIDGSTVYGRVAELASRLAVSAAFRERLQSDLGGAVGCSCDGQLTRAGRALSKLHVLSFERSDSRHETIVHARATLKSATLHWNFASDDCHATLSLRCDDEHRRPRTLLRVEAVRAERTAPAVTRVALHHAALVCLDRHHVRSGLDAVSLCHTLVGFLPEFLDESWELHEKVVDVVMRNAKRVNARARSVYLTRRWWRRKLWWRRHPAP